MEESETNSPVGKADPECRDAVIELFVDAVYDKFRSKLPDQPRDHVVTAFRAAAGEGEFNETIQGCIMTTLAAMGVDLTNPAYSEDSFEVAFLMFHVLTTAADDVTGPDWDSWAQLQGTTPPTLLNCNSITEAQIRSLRVEALRTGDAVQAHWCDIALSPAEEEQAAVGRTLSSPVNDLPVTRTQARAVCATVLNKANGLIKNEDN